MSSHAREQNGAVEAKWICVKILDFSHCVKSVLCPGLHRPVGAGGHLPIGILAAASTDGVTLYWVKMKHMKGKGNVTCGYRF